MTTMTTDRIEKHVVLQAPRSRVWRALTEADQFGEWFGVKLARPFSVGADVTGQVSHHGYERMPFNLTIERMEAERVLTWRWHVLIDAESGRVSESGFDSMPREYRDAAYRGNEGGWTQQMVSIERYLAGAA